MLAVVSFMAMPTLALADENPHYKAAMDALKTAETHLNEAAKGAHRDAALKAVKSAMTHVKAAQAAEEKGEMKGGEMKGGEMKEHKKSTTTTTPPPK